MSPFKLRGPSLVWATIMSCSSAMLLFGYDQGVMSGLISSTRFESEIFGTEDPSATIAGLVVSIYEIGAFVGAISVMLFGQRFGRRISTGIGQTFAIIGAVLQATSYGLPQMIVARVVSGIGIGQITATVPVWMAEIAPVSRRGMAGGVMMAPAVLGLVISYWVDYGTSTASSSFSYRFPLALQLVFCLGQLSTIPFLPESPRWLASCRRNSEAKEVIAAIHDVDTMSESAEGTKMYNDIQLAIAIESDGKPAWKDLFVKGPMNLRRRTMLAFGGQAMQQLTGINVYAYYATVIFKQSVGVSNHTALILGGGTSLTFLVGTCIGLLCVDNFGRRPLMMFGFACTCLGMVLAAIGTSHESHAYGLVATVGIFFFMFTFGIGLQANCWLYAVEIMPLKLRFMGGSISAASGWIWNYAIVQATQPGIETLGYRFFIIWAVLNGIWGCVVYFFYPETMRKTLEELDDIFLKEENQAGVFDGSVVVIDKSNSIHVERSV